MSIWLFSILWKNSSNHRGNISANNPVDHGPSFVSLKMTAALAHLFFFYKITLLRSFILKIFFFSFRYVRDTSRTVLTFSSEVLSCGLQYQILVEFHFKRELKPNNWRGTRSLIWSTIEWTDLTVRYKVISKFKF